MVIDTGETAEAKNLMTNLLKRLILVVMASVILASCMPYHITATPKTNGKVVDANSQQPIAGVRVYFKEYPETAVTTNSDGSFEMLNFRKWIVVPLGPFDAAPPHGTLVIEAEGYETKEIRDLYGQEIVQEHIDLQRK